MYMWISTELIGDASDYYGPRILRSTLMNLCHIKALVHPLHLSAGSFISEIAAFATAIIKASLSMPLLLETAIFRKEKRGPSHTAAAMYVTPAKRK